MLKDIFVDDFDKEQVLLTLLNGGDCFLYAGKVYMKLNPTTELNKRINNFFYKNETNYPVVDIETGEIISYPNTKVIKLPNVYVSNKVDKYKKEIENLNQKESNE